MDLIVEHCPRCLVRNGRVSHLQLSDEPPAGSAFPHPGEPPTGSPFPLGQPPEAEAALRA